MSLTLEAILKAEWAQDITDNTYEEFVAHKGIKWMEEMSYSGDIDMSFEEFVMTPYIDEALAL